MARAKKQVKAKEPVRLRMKPLSNGNKSLYLDIYHNGKRTYEYLKLYLVPDAGDAIAQHQNAITMMAANARKSRRIIEITSSESGIFVPELKDFLWTGCKPIWKANRNGAGKILHKFGSRFVSLRSMQERIRYSMKWIKPFVKVS